MPTTSTNKTQMTTQQQLIDTFIRYAKVSTASSSTSNTSPSTQCQFDLANILLKELQQLGIRAELSDKCYVYAYFNEQNENDRLILSAHMDVSEDAPSINVCPEVHIYQGGDLQLSNGVISEDKLPNIQKGDCLVTSDGTTLLGADCKAGIAIIMCLLSELINIQLNNPIQLQNIPSICVCFNPDEEICHGMDNVDLTKLTNGIQNVRGLTLDGGRECELTFNTFNAWQFEIDVQTKQQVYDCIQISSTLIQSIRDKIQPPYESKDKEGYVLIKNVIANENTAKIIGIARSFQKEEVEQFKSQLQNISRESLTDKEYIEQLTKLGQKQEYNSKIEFFRGGTDGALLSERGIQCPNCWNGMGNIHSVNEYMHVGETMKCIAFLKDLLGIQQ